MDKPSCSCYYIADIIIIQCPTLHVSSIVAGFWTFLEQWTPDMFVFFPSTFTVNGPNFI